MKIFTIWLAILGLSITVAVVSCAPLQMAPDAGSVALDHAAMFSNSAVLAIETAQRSAEVTYYAAQKRVIEKSIREKWSRATYDDAINLVRAEWRPVWVAFKRTRDAHGLLVDAIDKGEGATQIAALVSNLSNQRRLLGDAIRTPRSLLKGTP